MVLNATTTPPVINYSLFLSYMITCLYVMDPVTIDATLCGFTTTLTKAVDDGYTLRIMPNNIVGSSKPITDTFSKSYM